MGRIKKEVEISESEKEIVISGPKEKELTLSGMVKEIDLKKNYKFVFNSSAPNQKEGSIVEVTGELIKIFLKAGYGILHK